MQSEPFEAFSTTATQLDTSTPPTSAQHGLDDHDHRPPGPTRSPGSSHELATDASFRSASGVVEQLRDLNISTPARDRISEYERALTPLTKSASEGPAFRVVQNKNSKHGGPRLDEFPNEVLTHILSHLTASSLSAMSLVSRRFYSLVTTPHAWRVAFARFFPGQNADDISKGLSPLDDTDSDQLRSERSLFTRLTPMSTWRTEYILRTRLLRSVARGKPTPKLGHTSRSGTGGNNSAVVTYGSQLFSRITHIHAAFGNGKKACRFIHGTDDTGVACLSDPASGKVDNWGLSDPQALPQFMDLFPGDQMYGHGTGYAGAPNVMDVSQPFGMIYGEGFPGGCAYYRATDEMRGRFLASHLVSVRLPGVPEVPYRQEAITSVWIAKTNAVSEETNGLVGMLTGSSLGIVSAYSVGYDRNNSSYRLAKGELTARWVLSPGVPIVAIAVDESYNLRRRLAGRIWAVALNALGECFYLTGVPQRPAVEKNTRSDEAQFYSMAWKTGRSVFWELAEPTRRRARENPYDTSEVDGSYSPRSSSDDMFLSSEQILAETREIEKFLILKPLHFRTVCDGWDMRRRLEVDFAGDDGHGAGEAFFVIDCGLEEEDKAGIKRFTRWRANSPVSQKPIPMTPPVRPPAPTMASLFGPPKAVSSPVEENFLPPRIPDAPGTSSPVSSGHTLVEEWRTSSFIGKGLAKSYITTSAIDSSTYALLTTEEDPLLNKSGESSVASPSHDGPALESGIMPGQRARFLALGTKLGGVFLWDMRSPQPANDEIVNDIHAFRMIQTDSPEISCLALSALYLVHGGNDGLVQAWDPLGSTMQPLRTLNSRFSSRARRRLIQAEASAQGVGMNLYAAGALCIDPNPIMLRGMVSLGTHLRYWSFSSSAADALTTKKRRLRRGSERGNNSGQRFISTGRGAIMDFIATEQEELKQDEVQQAREDAWLRGRFGVGLGGLTDVEAIQYAEMISREAFELAEERRLSDTSHRGGTTDSSSAHDRSVIDSGSVTPEGSRASEHKTDVQLDRDIEEAIRLSLLDGVNDGGSPPRASGSGSFEVPVTYKAKKSKQFGDIATDSSSYTPRILEEDGIDDLELALQLSLAEEQSRREAEAEWEEFPVLTPPELVGKGKGKDSW